MGNAPHENDLAPFMEGVNRELTTVYVDSGIELVFRPKRKL
jgi:hypothetical protein